MLVVACCVGWALERTRTSRNVRALEKSYAMLQASIDNFKAKEQKYQQLYTTLRTNSSVLLPASVGSDEDVRVAGKLFGVSQQMIVDGDVMTYSDTLATCVVEFLTDGQLVCDFPDPQLATGQSMRVNLKSSGNQRTTWIAESDGIDYVMTVDRNTPGIWSFRLEMSKDGQTIGGARQFYSDPSSR